MNNPVVKFYGVELTKIKTEADAIRALDAFIRNASDEEIEAACNELETLVNPVRSIVRSLLWKLEYPLSSQEFIRCFDLKYASA